jgi:predicted permease
MNWIAEVRAEFDRLGKPADEDVIEELAQHAAAAWQTALADGEPSEVAARRIRALVGAWCASTTGRRTTGGEAVRTTPGGVVPTRRGGLAWLGDIVDDLRCAVRQLCREPSFSLTAVLPLAAGIAASTALFSVTYGAWFNVYPYDRVDEIRSPRAVNPNDSSAHISADGRYGSREFMEIARLPAVEEVFGYAPRHNTPLTGDHPPESVGVLRVSTNTFLALGVPALLGRTILPSDLNQGGEAAPVAVLSFKLWNRLFGGRRDIAGRWITVDGRPHLVVGVMPQRFGWGSDRLPTNDGIYLPLSTSTRFGDIQTWVRLRPGVSEQVAAEQFHALFLRLSKDAGVRWAFPSGEFRTEFVQFVDGTGTYASRVRQMRASLTTLLSAVALLFLVACVSTTSLQLTRASARTRDMAVRLALGASPLRIARQVTIESVCLAVVSGAIGVVNAGVLVRAVVAMIPTGFIPVESAINLNMTVLLFAVATSILSGLMVSVVPAVQGSRSSVIAALKDRGQGSGMHARRTRRVLTSMEIALAVVLVMAANLAALAYVRLQAVDVGFNPDRMLESKIRFLREESSEELMLSGASHEHRFVASVAERVEAAPGIEAAAVRMRYFTSRGYDIRGGNGHQSGILEVTVTTPNYFKAMEIALKEGRHVTADEAAIGEPVAVINEAAARLWPAGQRPVGGHISLYVGGSTSPPVDVAIVGVVANSLDRVAPGAAFRRVSRAQPAVFVPLATTIRAKVPGPVAPELVVRTRHENPLASVSAVRAAAFDVDPMALIYGFLDMGDLLAGGRPQSRFNAWLFGALAGVALLLAAAGIYAVLSYQVSRQAREIGVRMALGADRARVRRMVVGDAARLVASGLATGIAITVLVRHYVTAGIFGIPELDPLALCATVVVLGATAAVASYVPARRATKVDPLIALRSE